MTLDITKIDTARLASAEEAVKLVQEVVDFRGPEFVYEAIEDGNGGLYCMYVDPNAGEPSCAVGVALHKVGVPLDFLRKYDTSGGLTARQVVEGLRQEGVPVSREAEDVFSTAQTQQDRGDVYKDMMKTVVAYHLEMR
jgi:hypothetical protein